MDELLDSLEDLSDAVCGGCNKGGNSEASRVKKSYLWCLLALFIIVILIVFIVLMCGITVVGTLEVGIFVNKATHKASGPYNNGVYFAAPWTEIVTYPTTMMYLTADTSRSSDYGKPIHAWTKEGQEIDIDIAIMFHIIKDNIMFVYRNFYKSYKSFLLPSVVSIIAADAVKYTVMEYFQKRADIAQTMENDLSKMFLENGFELDEFQMLRQIIPPSFDTIVENKVVTEQKALTTLYERNVTLVESEITIIQRILIISYIIFKLYYYIETALKNISIILAEAEKTSKKLITDAQAYSLEVVQTTLAKSYSELANELNMTISFFYKFI